MRRIIDLLREVSTGKTGLLVANGLPNTMFKIGDGTLFVRNGSKFVLRSVLPDIIVVVGPMDSDIVQLLREKQRGLMDPLFYHESRA